MEKKNFEEIVKDKLQVNFEELEERVKKIVSDDDEKEEDIFTDSDSDSDDPTYDGIRVMDSSTKEDKAEFDRVRFKREKIYEDKLATFNIPEKLKGKEDQIIKDWIKKHVLGKVAKKLDVIESKDEKLTVRCIEDTGKEADVVMSWVTKVRKFKIVLYGTNEVVKTELKKAVLILRENFPEWKITAKLGDPKAREDHDNMHKKK